MKEFGLEKNESVVEELWNKEATNLSKGRLTTTVAAHDAKLNVLN